MRAEVTKPQDKTMRKTHDARQGTSSRRTVYVRYAEVTARSACSPGETPARGTAHAQILICISRVMRRAAECSIAETQKEKTSAVKR